MRLMMIFQILLVNGDLIGFNRLQNTLIKHRGRKFFDS